MSVPNRFHDSADQADPVKRSDHVESVCRTRYRLPDFHGYLQSQIFRLFPVQTSISLNQRLFHIDAVHLAVHKTSISFADDRHNSASKLIALIFSAPNTWKG